LFAVRKIEGGQKGVCDHIAQHNDLAIVDDWGTGKTPLGAGDHKETSFQGTEIFFPNEFSGVIKTEKPFGSEQSNDAFAICGWSRIAVGRFRMRLHPGNTFVTQRFPLELA